MQQYFDLERLLDAAALQQHCQAYGESFPMLAMRAACQHLQQAILPSNATPQADPIQAYQPQAFPQGDIWQVHICTFKNCQCTHEDQTALLVCI